jgi:predicted metal-dependent TIM-barrel fold hydrolase
MRYAEPSGRPSARSVDDYRAMAAAGVTLVVEPSGGEGRPRTHAGTFEDEFGALLRWEPRRAGGHGVRHVCALGLHGRHCADRGLVEAVLWLLARLIEKDGVVAVGELGFDEGGAAEEDAFARQIELARRFELPVLARVPRHDPGRGLERSLALLRGSGLPEGAAAIAGAGEPSLAAVLDAGAWALVTLDAALGLSPDSAPDLLRRWGGERLLLSGGADRGGGDPLAVPAAAQALRRGGFDAPAIERVLWDNPAAFFGRGGRLNA